MPWLNSCCGEETQASSAPPHATARRGPPSAVQMIHTDSFSCQKQTRFPTETESFSYQKNRIVFTPKMESYSYQKQTRFPTKNRLVFLLKTESFPLKTHNSFPHKRGIAFLPKTERNSRSQTRNRLGGRRGAALQPATVRTQEVRTQEATEVLEAIEVSLVDEAPPSSPRLYGPKKYGPKKLQKCSRL